MNDTTQAVAAPTSVDSTGMAYLDTRKRRVMTVYLPLAGFLFVLLFPFYWMAITTFKPNEELLSREGNPFWVRNPTLAKVRCSLPPEGAQSVPRGGPSGLTA